MKTFSRHRRVLRRRISFTTLCAVAALTAIPAITLGADVTPARLLHADQEPQNWLTYYGNYRGWRYSTLPQINTSNVQKLTVKWTFVPGAEEDFQVTPMVADGIMYLTTPKHSVYALDATSGKVLWRYNHKFPENMAVSIWGPSKSRGVALARDRVLFATRLLQRPKLRRRVCIAVNDEEIFLALEKRAHFPQASSGAEDLRLTREDRVAKILLDHLRKVVEVHNDLAHIRGVREVDEVADQRPSGERHHRLGQRVRDRAQPRAVARGENHGLQRSSGANTMFSGRSLRVRRACR